MFPDFPSYIKFDLLRSFVALAKTLHYGSAAELLNVSQPSLSKHINRLEDLLGTALFKRNRHGTSLTPFGQQFLDDIRPAMNNISLVWDHNIARAKGEKGNIRIGLSSSSIPFLSQLLFFFRQQYPHVSVEFSDLPSNAQITALTEHRLDVGFVHNGTPDVLSYHPITMDRLTLVTSWNMKENIDHIQKLQRSANALIRLNEGLYPSVDFNIRHFILTMGWTELPIYYVNNATTAILLARCGIGIAILYESAVHGLFGSSEDIATRSMVDPSYTWEIGLAWRTREENPMVQKFVGLARRLSPWTE